MICVIVWCCGLGVYTLKAGNCHLRYMEKHRGGIPEMVHENPEALTCHPHSAA